MHYSKLIHQQDCRPARHAQRAEASMARRSADLFDMAKSEKKANRTARQREEIAERYKAGYRPENDKAVQRAASALGLSTSHISPRGNKTKSKWACEVAVGGGVVAVKGRKPTHIKNGGGIRAEVKGFSKAARRRLLRKVGIIDRDAIRHMPNAINLSCNLIACHNLAVFAQK